jgi:hypothetical protein
MEHAEWRTAYYSVVLGITTRTYFPGDFAQDRAIRSAQRDAAEGYEGSAPVRVECRDEDGRWNEYARYEGSAANA